MTVQEAKNILNSSTPKGNNAMCIFLQEAVEMAIKALEEVEQYRALGTVEELKEAREKQIPMKIKEIHVDEYYCPACGSELTCNDARVEDKYCSECGQRFEVSEEDEN